MTSNPWDPAPTRKRAGSRPRVRMKKRFLPAAALLLVAACFESTPGASGELGNGTFEYGCVDPSDALCGECTAIGCNSTFAEDALGRTPMALGATFRARYHSRNDANSIRSASQERLLAEGQEEFVALKPGWVALLGEAPDGSNDLIHILIEEPDAVGVFMRAASAGDETEVRLNLEEVLQLEVGERVVLVGEPMRGDQTLGGALGATWTPDSATSSVNATGFINDNRTTVTATAEGDATVTIEMGDYAATVSIEVVEPADEGGNP